MEQEKELDEKGPSHTGTDVVQNDDYSIIEATTSQVEYHCIDQDECKVNEDSRDNQDVSRDMLDNSKILICRVFY